MTDTLPTPELNITTLLEALLFVSPSTLTPTQLAKVLDVPTRQIEKELDSLQAEYAQRGIRLQRHQGRVQLTTAPEAAAYIEILLGLEANSRLSNAALETLAIVAYKQPVTRPQIDSIRGVNSDGVLRSLLNKGLIEEVGRAETMGRPMLYATTADFLQAFGFSSLDDLPPLEENVADLQPAVAQSSSPPLPE